MPAKKKRDIISGHTRIAVRDLPALRKKILDEQGWLCPLCQRNLKYVKPQQRCIDHDHAKTGPSAGAIRGVLCSNCNGNEGRVKRRVVCSKGHLEDIVWLENLLNYWKKHKTNQTGLIHHTYKTPNELRLAKNAKARKRYKRKVG